MLLEALALIGGGVLGVGDGGNGGREFCNEQRNGAMKIKVKTTCEEIPVE